MGNAARQDPRGLELAQDELIDLRPFALGHVGHRGAALAPRRGKHRFDVHRDRGFALPEEGHFAELPVFALEYLLEKHIPLREVGFGNAMAEARLQQTGASDPQQAGCG